LLALSLNVSEEEATEIGKNCRRREPHSHLMPPPRGTPANIRIRLIFPENRVNWLHFARLYMYCGSIFICLAVAASQNAK